MYTESSNQHTNGYLLMREWLRTLVIHGSSFLSKPQSGVYIMNGHYLSRAVNDDPELFDSLLTKLSKYVRFINIQNAVDIVRSGEASSVDETLMAFTFDDGFDDCWFSLAPALEKFNTNACFFVNPGFVDGDGDYQRNFVDQIVLTKQKKPMNWEQLSSLVDRGFVIGNHTLDHLRLSDISLIDVEHQVIEGKKRIEQSLNIDCQYFAWPFGQYVDVNQKVIDLLLTHHSEVFSGCDFMRYMSFDGNVFNRRHFEADWSVNEVKYFLSKKRVYRT